MTSVQLTNIKGAIFDVDDTLLNNQTEIGLLHEISRFQAVKTVAKKYKLSALDDLTHEENLDAFLTAHVHSLTGAVWNILFQKGLVQTEDPDYKHELLNEIVDLKNELHADVLRQNGQAIVGAVDTVHSLARKYGISKKMAIASSAVRRDINIFLDEMTDLRQYFPDERIVSLESIPHHLGKPHPEPFDRAFKLLGLPESDRRSVIAFEDDPKGVASAKAAGLFVCAITSRYPRTHQQLIDSQPDLVIDSYAEFSEVYL